jgi:16S rRNA (uracil1498-N3)-methyltransferase
MPVDRFFLNADFVEGEPLFLIDEEFHHLCKVTRHQSGEEIQLVNGKNQIARAHIEKIEKRRAVLQVEQVETISVRGPRIILGQIIPKWNRLDTIIEKGTELGVHEFWLIPSLHAKKETFSPHQTERLKHICIAAMKQCGRLDLPSLHFHENLQHLSPTSGCVFFGDTRENAPLLWTALQKKSSPFETILFFIGPEGGFLPEEITILEKDWRAQPVALSKNILRTDTASITAMSLVQHFLLAPDTD